MNKELQKSLETAILVSIALILNYFETLWLRLPYGGSIGISLIPLIIAGLRNGIIHGSVAGLLMSLIKMLISPKLSIIPGNLVVVCIQVLIDYILVYPVVGLTCGIYSYLVKQKKLELRLSYVLLFTFLAGFFRYILHVVSGFLFWSEYNIELFGIKFNTFWYSIIYNATYIVPSVILSLIIICVIYLKNKNLLFR